MKTHEKVSAEDVRTIRRRYQMGDPMKALAYDFKLSRQQISRIVKRISRKDVR